MLQLTLFIKLFHIVSAILVLAGSVDANSRGQRRPKRMISKFSMPSLSSVATLKICSSFPALC